MRYSVLACLALLACTDSLTPTPAPTRQLARRASDDARPNFVVILTDDQRADDTLYMPQTMARIARQGTVFRNAFVTQSLCCPSRSSLFTGLYTHNHGVHDVKLPLGGWEVFAHNGNEQHTIALALEQSGYATGMFGKYMNAFTGVTPPPGWTRWYSFFGNAETNDRLYADYNVNNQGVIEQVLEYSTDVLRDTAAAFVSQHARAGEPFFAWVAPYAPHAPAVPAARHAGIPVILPRRPPSFDEGNVSDKPDSIQLLLPFDHHDRTNYAKRYRGRQRTLMAVDEMVAALLDTLDVTGVAATTYVLFLSDNGFHLGEHRLRTGKNTAYEPDIRIPLFIKGPGVIQQQRGELVANIDLAPTIATLAGVAVAPADAIDGRTLVPLLDGLCVTWRQRLLIESHMGSPANLGLRTATMKYTEFATGFRELYDLTTDPDEKRNIAIAQPTRTRSFHHSVVTLRSCVGDACRLAEGSAPACDVPGTPVASIDVTPAQEYLRVDSTLALTATPRDGDGNPLVRYVGWSSSDNSIATVSSAGVVTGHAEGTVTISAMAEGQVGTTSIDVYVPVTTSIVMTPVDTTLLTGDTALFVVSASDQHSREIVGAPITWSSTDDAVATFDTAVVIAHAPGSVTVTAAVGDVSATATVTVNLGPATEIALSSGDGQTAYTGAVLAQPLVVVVTDRVGNPEPDVTVTWTVTGGGGSFDVATSQTDVNGQASAQWTLGSDVGTQTAEASVTDLTGSPVQFSATAEEIPPAPVRYTWVGGDASAPTDWSVAANWSPAAVPTTIDTVDVPGTSNQPVLTGDVTVAALIIESGATLDNGGFSVTVNGDLLVDGAITGTGLVHLAASGAHVRGTFSNLEIAQSATVSAGSNLTSETLTITGTLTVEATSLVDVTGVAGSLVLESGSVLDNSGTVQAELPVTDNGGTVTGNPIVQR